MTSFQRVRRSFIAAAWAGLLCSCTTSTPTMTQVSAFGTASETLAEHTQKAFHLVDSVRVERGIYDVASDPSAGPNEKMFAGLFENTEGQALQLRLGMLAALGDYAAGLKALASADFRSGIDEASTKLHGALASLSENYTEATGNPVPSSKTLGFIAPLVDAIGSVIVETKRREAIRAIVLEVDPTVQAAAELIQKELSRDSEMAKYAQESLRANFGSAMQAYNQQRTRPDSDFAERRAMLREIRDLRNAAADCPAYFESVSQGARELGKAHAALRAAVQKNQFSSSELGARIGELAKFAKSVKKFHESLNKAETAP